ncbi:MAG: carboxypeptidase regulatory-like domain-containing protein, partial [Streptosporangiaceae bacterium]
MRYRMRTRIRGSRWLSLVTGTATAAALTLLGTATAQASPAVAHAAAASPAAAPVLAANTNAPCNVTPKPGDARCYAIVRTPAGHDLRAAADRSGPPATALTPADIQSAYRLPATAGAGQTVAIVDAYGDSHAASDLAAFRSHYGLPACTTANGCFRKVNQAGGTAYPADDSGWALETSLDLDAVSSACPRCHILLVEGSSPSIADLAAAENEAVKLGAKFISNSYGANEDPSLLAYDSAYQHPGVAVTVSTGDTGNLVEWPSSDPDVTAAGGTTLAKDPSVSRGWDETAWDSGGSGCSTIEPQPQYQLGITTDCTMRATADVSADANPASGLGIYDTLLPNGEGGWLQVGGTSLASPLITSMYALAGAPVAGTYPVNYPYHDPSQASDLFDITQGSNGSCGDVLCTAGQGWDGPTGLGSPDGVKAFSGGPQGQITGKVTDARTGQPVAGVTITASPGNYATRTGASGTYTLGVTAGSYTVSAAMYAYQTGHSGTEKVPANGSATASFSLAELPHATVSGTVTDGSGHGWPLYAKITIGGGYPGAPVYTNPFTGRYRVVLAGPARYPVQVTSAQPEVLGTAGDGYAEQDVTLSVGTGTQSRHFALKADKAACAAPGYGPAGLAQDFSGWAGSSPRAGWTVTGTRAGWRFDNPGSRPAPGDTDSGDQFAIADSGTSGGRMDSSLTSPAVSLSGQSAPAIRFASGYYGGLGQHAEIDLSTDNGRTWTQVWHHGTGDAVGPVSVPVPRAAGKSGVRVRFRYAGDDAWWWSVGDVLIGTPGCAALRGGLVTGLVTQHGSGRPVDGATVTSAGTGSGI